MVRLFSTVLRREPDGRHVLVTPAEKLDIDVDCTAFRAIAMSREGQGRDQRIAFQLDSGDAVILGPDHPLRGRRERKRPLAPAARSSWARGRADAVRLLRAGRAGARRRVRGVRNMERRRILPARREPMTAALADRLREALAWPGIRAAARRRSPGVARACRCSGGGAHRDDGPAEPGVILTVRREHLRTHAGQIAFPGGRVDPAKSRWKRRSARPMRRSCSIRATVEVVAALDPTGPSPAMSSLR